MTKSAYAANRGPNAVQQPPAKPDRMMRCQKCFVSDGAFGAAPVGTLMIQEAVSLIVDGEANVVIGKTIRCPNSVTKKRRFDGALKMHVRVCDCRAMFIPAPAFAELGIERSKVYALLDACMGVPNFHLHELYAGEMDPVELPKSIAEGERPVFGKPDQVKAEPEPALFSEGGVV